MGFAALYPSYALPILRIRCPGSLMFDFTPAELTAIALSLKVATVAALASLPFGIATGWLLARKRFFGKALVDRSEEHTSELQSLMRITYAVFCLEKTNK